MKHATKGVGRLTVTYFWFGSLLTSQIRPIKSGSLKRKTGCLNFTSRTTSNSFLLFFFFLPILHSNIKWCWLHTNLYNIITVTVNLIFLNWSIHQYVSFQNYNSPSHSPNGANQLPISIIYKVLDGSKINILKLLLLVHQQSYC